MATGKRFRIADSGGVAVPVVRFQTEANDTSVGITGGVFYKWKSNGSPYVVPLVDGDHTIGTDTAIVGLAASNSTATASADGTVDIYMPLPGIVYEGSVTTAANFNTEALAKALLGDRVGIDISATTDAGNWTVDENEGETQTLAFCLVGYDVSDTSDPKARFVVRHGATYLGDQDLS